MVHFCFGRIRLPDDACESAFRATSHLSVRLLTAMCVTVNEVLSHLCKNLNTEYSQKISTDRTDAKPPETSRSIPKRPKNAFVF